jgi:hypothetical protein
MLALRSGRASPTATNGPGGDLQHSEAPEGRGTESEEEPLLDPTRDDDIPELLYVKVVAPERMDEGFEFEKEIVTFRKWREETDLQLPSIVKIVIPPGGVNRGHAFYESVPLSHISGSPVSWICFSMEFSTRMCWPRVVPHVVSEFFVCAGVFEAWVHL